MSQSPESAPRGTPLFQAAARLAAQGAQPVRVHLLVDQSGLPNITTLWRLFDGIAWHCVLGERHAQPDTASPLLLDVTPALESARHEVLLDRLYVQGRYANCLSLLAGPLPGPALAQALAARAQARLPQGLRVLLRTFDTRTLPLLPRLLGPTDYGRFMACASAWHFIGRHGELQMLPPAPSGQAAAPAFAPPWEFDARQEQLLIDDGLTDAVIDQLIEQRHPVLTDVNPGQQFDLVHPLVTQATREGIHDHHELLASCGSALLASCRASR